ncbi:DNA-binding NarL/FixJ family response regulator [Dyella sp. SG562]|uniref:response regulator transcription factor n=1 Tax=Dyella TaxID=231454 RepID=UPI00142068D4|nr:MULTISPECIES: response regulator transcription factor [unclassified Dyella]NII73281.1 DNA-binding NarL/FixJ family response regulator [Dyella sp. SG562]NKJ19892.1 DNA-binding NarL/FixJ family response regulator [Dyella sp. SG609]
MFTAVIVDDHPMINGAIRNMLERTGEFKVLAECTSGQLALSVAMELQPDLLVIDLDIPQPDGIEVICRLREGGGPMAILMISASEETVSGVRAFRAGADGFVHKCAPMEDVVAAAQLIVRGKIYFSRGIMDAASSLAAKGTRSPLHELGRREFEVFRCLALGMANIDIARHMSISNKTVSAHKRNLMDKLGLANIREVIELARQHRIIE